MDAQADSLEKAWKLLNIQADTMLEQRKWEPMKAISAAFGTGMAVASGLIALAAWIIARAR